VDFGVAQLVPDAQHPQGWTLLLDGTPQSHVDTDDPTRLEFEYVRRLASVVDAAATPGAAIDVLHLGGGALSLPRYVAATRPGSYQRVVERDAALVALVRRVLPLPRSQPIRVRTRDARQEVETTAAARFDVIVADVFGGARVPASVCSVEFATAVARALRPDGLYTMNLADSPPLTFTRGQVATLRQVFADVCLLAEAGVLRGRRYGNVVLVAAGPRGRLPVADIGVSALRDAFPARLLHGAELERFTAGAAVVTDATAVDSPGPPRGFFGRSVPP
jgi:spermidine synthase